MSLADFDAMPVAPSGGGGYGGGGGGGAYRAPGGGGGFGSRGGGDIVLPTGPATRDPEDAVGADGRRPGQLGGAFSDYGGDRGGGRPVGGFGDRDERRGGERFADRSDDRRGGFGDRRGGDDFDPRDRDEREPEGPSRADADSNWGKSKPVRGASPPRRGGFDDRGRDDRGRGGRFDERRGGSDDRDDRRERYPSRSPSPERDWGALRHRTGPSTRDDRDERRGGFDDRRSPSPERDWGSIRDRPGPPARDDRDRGRDDDRGARPGARADAAGDRWGKSDLPPKEERERDGGDRDDRDSGRDGGRPRLNLKARSKDAPVAASGGGGGLFGGARPREAALKEAGRDFIKEDLALSRSGSVRRKKHADEKAIEDDITALKKSLESEADEGEKSKFKQTIGEAETALAKLTLELDDKVKFSQRDNKAGGDKKENEAEDGEKKGRRVAGGERERDMDKGWGEGKSERQQSRGGRGGRNEKKEEPKKEERAPRAPKVLAAAEPEAVKVGAGGFAALSMDDE